MAVVRVRLSEDDVRKLNVLMKRGIYKNRSGAIRAIVDEGLRVKLGEDDDVTQIVDRLLALRKRGKFRCGSNQGRLQPR